jgi:Ca2+-binding RTX toxin-like protein
MPVYPSAFTSQQIADQLTRSGQYWNRQTVTYSFNNSSTPRNALDATFQAWTNAAVQTVEEMLGIDFQLVAGPGNITFNGSRNNGTYASSNWSVPGNAYTSANIYFDQSWASNQSSNLGYGSYGLMTIIHEFLHTLGLDHPGSYNGSGTYFPDAPFLQDTHRYTVMSYFEADADGSGTSHWLKVNGTWEWQYPQTPMVYDLLALTDGNFAGNFSGYVPNAATRAGNTTYGYNATAGINSVFDFAVNDGPVLTIYDAAGNDTLDLSGDAVATLRVVTYDAAGNPLTTEGVRTTSVIDLNPGSYSSTHGMLNNIGIAFGTLVENAIATGFNDTMTGNYLANVLMGGAGWDTINGGLGGDFLIGGTGTDSLTGGAGADWFAFASGAFEGDAINDYAAGDYVYFGGSSGAVNFSISGANVIASTATLFGATAGDVTVITQASSALLSAANIASIAAVLGGGPGWLGAFGAYDIATFDANSNDAWRTVTSSYTAANLLDYAVTAYDAGQPYYSLLTDYDQGAAANWGTLNTYYSAANVADFNWVYYDAGQALYASTTNFDQASANNWANIQTFYSALNITDYSYVNYDTGQPLYSAAVDYDQLANQTWGRVETFFSASGVTDYYWTYYDAGQAYYAATIDYDQINAQTWYRIDTFFSSAGVTDFTWAYFDAGQPLYARLVDYDQGSLYAWNQHVVEYDTSTHVLNDYYI